VLVSEGQSVKNEKWEAGMRKTGDGSKGKKIQMNKRKGTIPERIKRLFWDVDKQKADIKGHRSFIIRRIMNFGNMDDVKWMLKVYTSDEIIEVVKKSRGLSRKSAYFWATYFNIPEKEVECLKTPYQKNLKPF
jgi:hypothetical protein